MSINTKVIGFVGSEQFDLILYLSRVLKNLDKKVLLIDFSQDFKLSACIPFSKQMLAKNKNNSKVIDYSGVDIIMKGEEEKNISFYMGSDYDFILVDFGFNLKDKNIMKCNDLFLVTDFYKTNVSKFNNSLLDEFQNKFLVFRDVVDGKLTPGYILDEHLPNLEVERKHCNTLYLDSIDIKIKIDLQYDTNVRFKKLSSNLKNWIKDVATYLSGQTKKEIEKAYKAAERGE